MKSHSYLFVVVCLASLFSFTVQAQSIYQVGDSLTTNAVNAYPCPYGNDNDDSRHQMLFLASELSAAGMLEGDITSFAMRVAVSNQEELFDYSILMALTTDSALGSSWIGGLSTVWGAQDHTNQLGWNTHTLSNPFYWDGLSNLIVQTCNDNQNNSDNPVMVHTTTSFTSTIWRLTNQGNICFTSGPPTDQSFDRPIVQFGLIPAFAPPISNFSPVNISSCSGTIQFSDLSSFDPTSWQWDFGDGLSDTVQNPLHTYAMDGTYDVTLITSNAFGSDTLTVVGTITINASGPQPVAACIPSTSASLGGFGILNISFANTSVNSSDGQSENYADRSCFLDTVLAGTVLNINITTGSVAPHNVRVWIDWNNSGTFSAAELVLTDNSVNSATMALTVPGTATLNTPIRLRAIADYELSPFPTPCGNPQYGQAEDYGLVILPNTQPPISDFSAAPTITCTGIVQFTDLSLNSPTVWQWNFGDSNTDNDQNPLHTYTADGTYSVQLITFNSFGTDTIVLQNYITVDLGSQLVTANCLPQTQAVLGDYGILSVDLSTISSTSPDASEGYQDRSCEFNTTLTEGVTVPISIGTGIQNSHDVFIWLDLNNDGDLDASELIWSALDVNNPSGTITIPTGAVYNTPLRLRITVDAQGTISSSCDDPSFGQTEDYGLTVLQNTSPPTALFNASPTSVCAGDPVQFNDLSQNLPVTWSWDFGDSGISSDQNPQYTYFVPGSYNVTLSVTNPNGSDAITQTGYITVIDSAICDTTLLGGFGTQTETSCSGVVADNGGANGDYTFFGQGLLSIQPTSGDVVILSFSQFDISQQDNFTVYDGPDNLSPVIGTYNGTTLPNGGQIISSGNSISFELEVLGFGGAAGFIVDWQCSFVGVEEYAERGFALFPNPASTMISIGLDKALSGNSQLSILNSLGQVVLHRSLVLDSGKTDIDISALATGTYTLLIENDSRNFADQLIVK